MRVPISNLYIDWYVSDKKEISPSLTTRMNSQTDRGRVRHRETVVKQRICHLFASGFPPGYVYVEGDMGHATVRGYTFNFIERTNVE